MTSLADRIPEPTFSPFKEVFDRAKTKAAADGEARGEARAIIRVLTARGLPITNAIRQKIQACTDPDTLDHWAGKAATVTTTDDIFTAADRPE